MACSQNQVFTLLPMQVVFTNEQTGEYQYYELTIRAGRPGVISTIELSTPVRQSIQHTLELENPLSYQVSFSFSCSVPELLMPGTSLQVPPESKVPLQQWPTVQSVIHI